MARVVIEREDGTKEVVRDGLPENVWLGDILFRYDYLAGKLWQKDDILEQLEDMGYDRSKENYAAVVNSGYLEDLNDCTDTDWQIIRNAINWTLGGK